MCIRDRLYTGDHFDALQSIDASSQVSTVEPVCNGDFKLAVRKYSRSVYDNTIKSQVNELKTQLAQYSEQEIEDARSRSTSIGELKRGIEVGF